MKSFEYIHGIFTGCYFSGFSLVWYHEEFIDKAMKTPLCHEITVQKPWLSLVLIFNVFVLWWWKSYESNSKSSRKISWVSHGITRNSGSWKTSGFPLNLELLMVHGNILSKFMDFSLHCNDRWKSKLIRWKSFHLERGEACTLDEDL